MSHNRDCSCCHSAEFDGLVVFGDGNHDADIFIIGEAPGEDESKSGMPFVGRSGQLLDLILSEVGIIRHECYISNVLKRRPPDNRKPFPKETKVCGRFLMQQISIIRPKAIVTMGVTSTNFMLENTVGLIEIRGEWNIWVNSASSPKLEVPLMPTFHPSYALRDSSNCRRKLIAYDLGLVAKFCKDARVNLAPAGTAG